MRSSETSPSRLPLPCYKLTHPGYRPLCTRRQSGRGEDLPRHALPDDHRTVGGRGLDYRVGAVPVGPSLDVAGRACTRNPVSVKQGGHRGCACLLEDGDDWRDGTPRDSRHFGPGARRPGAPGPRAGPYQKRGKDLPCENPLRSGMASPPARYQETPVLSHGVR
jgi:hypothetical protein